MSKKITNINPTGSGSNQPPPLTPEQKSLKEKLEQILGNKHKAKITKPLLEKLLGLSNIDRNSILKILSEYRIKNLHKGQPEYIIKFLEDLKQENIKERDESKIGKLISILPFISLNRPLPTKALINVVEEELPDNANPEKTDPASEDFDLVTWVLAKFLPNSQNLFKGDKKPTDKDIVEWIAKTIHPFNPNFDPYKYIRRDSTLTSTEFFDLQRAISNEYFLAKNISVMISESGVFIGRVLPELNEFAMAESGRKIPVHIVKALYSPLPSSIANISRITTPLEELALFLQSYEKHKQQLPLFKQGKLQETYISNENLVKDCAAAVCFGKDDTTDALRKFRNLIYLEQTTISDSILFAYEFAKKHKLSFNPSGCSQIASTILTEESPLRKRLAIEPQTARLILQLEGKLNAMTNSDFPLFSFLYDFNISEAENPIQFLKPVIPETVGGVAEKRILQSVGQQNTDFYYSSTDSRVLTNELLKMILDTIKGATRTVQDIPREFTQIQFGETLDDFYRIIGEEFKINNNLERTIDSMNRMFSKCAQIILHKNFYTYKEREIALNK